MSGTAPAPRLDPVVAPGGSLLRQFATMLLILIALAVSLTFLFVQTPAAPVTHHSTIVLVWSGMRPDMVTANLTPHLLALGDQGVVALDHHAALPGAPQTIITTLPAAQNTPILPSTTPAPTLPPSPVAPSGSAGASAASSALTAVARQALAQGVGISFEGAGAASLADDVAGKPHAFILDDQVSYPVDLAQQVTSAGLTITGELRDEAFTQAYLRLILPALKATNAPFFSVIAYDNVARTAAQSGIGATATLAAIQADDAALGKVIAAIPPTNNVNIIVTSDHGLADVIPPDLTSAANQRVTAPDASLRTNLAALMQTEATKGPHGLMPDFGPLAISAGVVNDGASLAVVTPGGGLDSITLPATTAFRTFAKGDLAAGRLQLAREVVAWLQAQPQVGAIFLNNQVGTLDGTLPMSAIADAATAPDLIVTFATLPQDVGQVATNSFRFAGATFADTSDLASWNTLSRRDLHIILYAAGPSFQSGVRDLAPTGANDLAPTLAHVLGIHPPVGFAARAINEMLSDGADANAATLTSYLDSNRVENTSHTSAYLATVITEQFQGVTYVQGIAAVRANATTDNAVLLVQAHALAIQE